MGLIKEYADRAVQTEAVTVPSPYVDPAVVLVAPPMTRLARGSDASPAGTNSTQVVPNSPVSPVLAPFVSRRPSKRKSARHPAGEIVNRRIASMPDDPPSIHPAASAKRVVSMPDRVRPLLEPSVELFQSPSTAAGDSFGSFGGRRERVHVFPTPSDVPQTPSPPSSPESLLIIAAGTQLSDGFLRRKFSPEPLIEEDEDWITWAHSPPRPIPALHGPLSLPYARCPSGAEGTIIEEPESVAQMIWGLSPDDQSHNQIRTVTEVLPNTDNSESTFLHGSSRVPPRLQKKRASIQQTPKLPRTQFPPHTNNSKPILVRTQQPHDNKRNSQNQVSPDPDVYQDTVNAVPWDEGQSLSASLGIVENLSSESDVFPIDNRILEWQLARLRHALRTSLADMDSYATYPGRLEPVIPATVNPGFPQTYPRIFVEPRPNESVVSAAKQSPIELAQQYRQQLYRQALQKQKLQSMLPTPPDSTSPQWSSQFSPYLTYRSTFSPELVGSAEYPVPVSSQQKIRSGANASQYLRHVFDRHEYDPGDSSANFPSVKTTQIVPNINPAATFRPSPSSSSTLAKYIKQLQALSPITHLSPLQAVPPPNAPPPSLPSTDQNGVGSFRGVYHSPAIPTPPSPESPQTGSPYNNVRSMISTRPMERRLSSVPEEDSALSEVSMSVSPSRLQKPGTTDGNSSSHDRATGYQAHYLELPHGDGTRRAVISDSPEFESKPETASVSLHDASPVKVRLPLNKEQNFREQTGGKEGHQHGLKKKHRFKKLKGPATNEMIKQRRVDL